MEGLQLKYHKKRVEYQFKNFMTFIYNFFKDQNEKKFHGISNIGKERENNESMKNSLNSNNTDV